MRLRKTRQKLGKREESAKEGKGKVEGKGEEI